MNSEVYSHGHHPSVTQAHATRTLADSGAYLIPHLRPGMTVLDVGCGPGSITADLARAVAPGTVTGLDRSPDVVAEAARLHAELPGVEFLTGTSTTWTSRTKPSTSCTPTRCSTTSPTRSPPCGRCAG
jgi:ubiquinone/menaquinone biosynthesis C-methylase UbiE